MNCGPSDKIIVLCILLSFCIAAMTYNDEFTKFKEKYNKIYKGDYDKSRFLAYQTNRKLQLWLNKSQPIQTAWYGDTKFSDLTHEEFKELYLSGLQVESGTKTSINNTTPIQALRQLRIQPKIDWRTYLNYSIVSNVKNQKKCGACWAFSTVETVESMYAKETGSKPLDLSVQEVIDCSRYNGCAGGDTCDALNWMVNTKAPIVTESVYPLTDVSNDCMMLSNQTKMEKVFVKSSTCYRLVGKEDKVLELLQEGPVSAAVDATTWANYQGGIIQYHCGAFNNHAIQIVGYDMTGDVPYYIVRNSWGADYGHNGYLYIRIGDNVCGIAERVSSVEVYT